MSDPSTPTLELIPAVDLRQGRCVRLLRGDPNAETVYYDDPVEAARRFEEAGCRRLHVVDLDGAFEGAPRNAGAIAAIARGTGLTLEVGGGLRSLETIEAVLELGADRAILGTAALEDRALLREACERFPGSVWVGIDARGGKVAVRGWAEQTAVEALTLAAEVAEAGAAGIVYTDIQRDGALVGPNVEETAKVARGLAIPVIASGGVRSLDDLTALAPLAADGVTGAISGRALYEGTLDAAEAIGHLAALAERG